MVTARFAILMSRIADIRSDAESGETLFPEFMVDVVNHETGDRVARVRKVLYVRKNRLSIGPFLCPDLGVWGGLLSRRLHVVNLVVLDQSKQGQVRLMWTIWCPRVRPKPHQLA